MKEKRLNHIKTIATKRLMTENIEEYCAELHWQELEDIEFVNKHFSNFRSFAVELSIFEGGGLFC